MLRSLVLNGPSKTEPNSLPTATSVVVVRDAAVLAEHLPALEDLAAAAEPSVFHEPWLLLPAVKSFGAGIDLHLVLVYFRERTEAGAPSTLAGFFPLERKTRFRGLPMPVVRLWKHRHCFLATPLLRHGKVSQCLNAFFRWLAADRAGASLVELPYLSVGGPCEQALVELCVRRGLRTVVHDDFERALLRPATSAEAYLGATLSTGVSKELRRQRRRLGEQGNLETRLLERQEDVRGGQSSSSTWRRPAGRAARAGRCGTRRADRSSSVRRWRQPIAAAGS